jgi:hypothetical protein
VHMQQRKPFRHGRDFPSLPYPTLHYPLYFSNRTFLHFPNRTFPKKIITIHLMRSYLGTLAMKKINIRINLFTIKRCNFSTSQRREAPFRAQARGEGTNSAWLFTPGKTKALAKSKVHQWSRAWVINGVERVTILTVADCHSEADCHE